MACLHHSIIFAHHSTISFCVLLWSFFPLWLHFRPALAGHSFPLLSPSHPVLSSLLSSSLKILLHPTAVAVVVVFLLSFIHATFFRLCWFLFFTCRANYPLTVSLPPHFPWNINNFSSSQWIPPEPFWLLAVLHILSLSFSLLLLFVFFDPIYSQSSSRTKKTSIPADLHRFSSTPPRLNPFNSHVYYAFIILVYLLVESL